MLISKNHSHPDILKTRFLLPRFYCIMETRYNELVRTQWEFIRAVASGGQLPPPRKPADNFLKRPNLRARLHADSFLSSLSKLKSLEMHF